MLLLLIVLMGIKTPLSPCSSNTRFQQSLLALEECVWRFNFEISCPLCRLDYPRSLTILLETLCQCELSCLIMLIFRFIMILFKVNQAIQCTVPD